MIHLVLAKASSSGLWRLGAQSRFRALKATLTMESAGNHSKNGSQTANGNQEIKKHGEEPAECWLPGVRGEDSVACCQLGLAAFPGLIWGL